MRSVESAPMPRADEPAAPVLEVLFVNGKPRPKPYYGVQNALQRLTAEVGWRRRSQGGGSQTTSIHDYTRRSVETDYSDSALMRLSFASERGVILQRKGFG